MSPPLDIVVSDSLDTMCPRDGRLSPSDILIQSLGAGAYVIRKVCGKQVATSQDRRHTMRCACAAADGTANVWICVEDDAETFYEVICP